LSQLSTLQSGGYTCTMTGGAQGGCPSPYAGSPGTRFEAGGYVWEITGWWCKSSAGGASWCSWDVACGATVNQTYYRVLICTRPAGYFPVPANMPPDSTGVRRYQLAPVYTICGRVRTDWVSGGTN
jgi:hypothetical protein